MQQSTVLLPEVEKESNLDQIYICKNNAKKTNSTMRFHLNGHTGHRISFTESKVDDPMDQQTFKVLQFNVQCRYEETHLYYINIS